MPHPALPALSRRQFLGATAAALAATAAPRPLAAEALAPLPAPTLQHNAFAYRFAIGDLEAWSISDGHLLFRDGVTLMHPAADRPVMRAELARRGERADGIPLYVNLLVVKLGAEIALFDGGFGPGKNPDTGWLAAGLAAAGVAPEKVTHAFLSHAHSDHIGGFVAGNRPVFPNAAVHCHRDELAFWRSPAPDFSKTKRARGPLPGMIKDARDKFDVLQPQLQLHTDGDRVLGDAITFVPGAGHTAGHALFRIRSGRESLLHFMDVAHHHVFMFANPGWGIAFDHDGEQATDTRRKTFAQLAATHERAYGFHLPWPGLGRVAAGGAGYEWQPERWSWGS